MNWKLKALCQAAISRTPGAATLNYWGQKWVTRAYADVASIVEDRIGKAHWFADQFAAHGGVALGDARFYEFGAGQNLAGPLALYCLGVNRQVLVDLTRAVRLDLVNRVIEELARYHGYLPRRPGAPLATLSELKTRFGIEYRAPADARRSGLPEGSIDCVTNTYTFEHIPPADALAIMQECARILKPGGAMLSLIDYQDHYSYRDSSISVYNFLRYTPRQWRWFNSSLHYQSRMRHCEYRQMFQDAGLGVVAEDLLQPSERDLRGLNAIRPAPEFERFSQEELVVLGSRMVCTAHAAESNRSRADRAVTAL